MYLQQLNYLKINRNLSDSKIAELAGVKRSTVCKWFQSKKDWINVETNSILHLSENLKISPEYFFKKLPTLQAQHTTFLWDTLYPDMPHFIFALIQKRPEAMARLVQVLGLHEAKCILGKDVLTKFQKYKKFIKPVRRKQLEVLWPLYNSQEKIATTSKTGQELQHSLREHKKVL